MCRYLVVSLTVKVLSQWAVNQRALPMKRRVPAKTQVTVGCPRSMACLAGAVARLAEASTGVTEGLLGALFYTIPSCGQ